MRLVADRFIDGVVAAARKLRVGDPKQADIEIGLMVLWVKGMHLVVELVDDAVANGAKLHCGGPTTVEDLSGETFYAPAVDAGHAGHAADAGGDPRPGRPDRRGRQRGGRDPVANDSPFGLGASVWTETATVPAIAHRIESGMVWINDHMYSHGAMQMPWAV